MLPPGGAASPLLRWPSIPARPRVPRFAEGGGGAGPHRAGQFGKILPRELDHVPNPQDGAEGGLVRVEAAGLHVGGGQIGQEVSPGKGRGKERGQAQGQGGDRPPSTSFSPACPSPQALPRAQAGASPLSLHPSPVTLSPISGS